MIIEQSKIIKNNESDHYLNNNEFETCYNGLIYIPEIGKGEKAVEYIIEKIKLNQFGFINHIRGIFIIFLFDKRNNESFVFTDNSGMYKAFISGTLISSSFLEIVDYTDNKLTLNYHALTEFLHYGFVFFNDTLFNEIKKVNPEYIYTFGETGALELIEKKIEKINKKTDSKPIHYFNDLHQCIKDEIISIDITAGADSRLIVSAFHSLNADFELAISGLPENMDVKIPKKISQKINKPLYCTYHDVSGIDDNMLKDIFKAIDGQTDIISCHRLYTMMNERRNRNITIHISGAGGELFKDYWWLQDFPFYKKKRSNISKLYDLRIESIVFPHHLLGKRIIDISKNIKNNTINKLKKYVGKTNTQTYDNIYYYYKMRTMAGTFLSLSKGNFISYAPLLELDLVRYGFNLPRKKRLYNNFHKQFITKYCPEISRIKTDAGTTCSSNLFLKVFDLFNFGFDFGKRFLKQMLRKILKRTYFQESPNNAELYPKIRKLEAVDEAVKILKDYEVLNKDIKNENINDFVLGKLLTLGMMIQRVKTKLKD